MGAPAVAARLCRRGGRSDEHRDLDLPLGIGQARRRYGVARICRVWGIARAGVYRQRCAAAPPPAPRRRPGPQGPMPDAALVEAIRQVLTDSPFHAGAPTRS
jgi:hypothetical protein